MVEVTLAAMGQTGEPMKPNRCLHLRHPEGFSDTMFERFEAGCELWDVFVQQSLSRWARFGSPFGDASYVCLPAELSDDRRVATLPLVSHSTLGSRARFEDAGAALLREFLPFEFALRLEEGLTEDIGDGRGMVTSWRKAFKASNAD